MNDTTTAFDPAEYLVHSERHAGGPHLTYKFPNGRGASVVQNSFSYGHAQGLWEVAVLDAAGSLDYSTPITDDVIGYLDQAGVNDTLRRVAELAEVSR